MYICKNTFLINRNMKKLYSFDFDDTLCFSKRPDVGMIEWEEKTGLKWPYNGWWSKAETLDPEIFYTPLNEWVYKRYLEAMADDDAYIIMATGRLEKVPNMRKNIEKILTQHNLSFDEIHLNWGGDTYRFKTKLFEELIKKTKCDHFIMYDDRHIHLEKFEQWAREQDVMVTITNVVTKKTRTFNK